MSGKAKGPMGKTRKKFRRKKGILTVNKILSNYPIGTKVQIDTDSSFHKGFPFRRYHGKTGTITKIRGSCCEVKVMAGNKEKLLIIHPVHLKLVGKTEKKTEKSVKEKNEVKK